LKGAEQDPVADYQAHDPRIAAFASVVDAYDLHGLVFRNFSITSKTRFFWGYYRVATQEIKEHNSKSRH